MKNKIERTMFWFKDENGVLPEMNEHFFALGILLNRLLNEKYFGKKIKFINIDFATIEKYNKYPAIPINYVRYYSGSGGLLAYYGLFNPIDFSMLSGYEQKKYIWQKAFEFLQISAKSIKNKDLLDASEYAYSMGLEKKLNTDYKLIESKNIIKNKEVVASIWIKFIENEMYSNLVLEEDGKRIFEKNIDKTKSGNEFFLEMYKSIEVIENVIIVKGHTDVDYFPIKMDISLLL
jgi:hypothetical protein